MYCGFLEVLLTLNDLAEVPEITSNSIFVTLDKKPVSARQLFDMFRKSGRVLIASQPDSLTEQLGNQSIILGSLIPGQMLSVVSKLIPILFLRVIDERLLEILRYTFFGLDLNKVLADPHHVYMPIEVVKMDPETTLFIDQTLKVLNEVAAIKYQKAVGFHPIGDDAPFFLFADQVTGKMLRPPLFSMDRREIGINLLHPHFQKVRRLWETNPEVAIFSMARFLLLDADRMLSTDEAMAIAAARFRKGNV
jgi:hypothetical protein